MKDKVKPKIGILSLGCPRNLVDSENILGRLNLKGYPIVDIGLADIAIVNTCAFINDAKTESIDAILGLVDLKAQGRLKKIIVYGCLAQRYKKVLIQELPEVDAFIGRVSLNHSRDTFSLTPRHYGYLKICEGCLNSCSYCIIPKIKGRFKSLKISSVLERAGYFNRRRISELNIIGQDITAYGADLYQAPKLTELLKMVLSKTKDINWIRLLYLYPSRVTEELIGLIRDEGRICKYIDLPIQHINQRILRLMHRPMTKGDILKLIKKIRAQIPGVGIRTSLIVGFPSETDKEFRELIDFIREVKFERLGVFVYSREEGTRAAALEKQVPEKTKHERLQEVMLRQKVISEEVNKKFLGQTIEVLVEEKEKDCYLGRSQYDAPEVDGLVYISSSCALKAGDMVKVKITDTLEYDLVGEAIV